MTGRELTVVERPNSEISPSAYARVRACTGSVQLTRAMRRRGSTFRAAGAAATEGSAAHSLLEHGLRYGVDPAEIEAVRVGGERVLVTDRMREAVAFALGWIRQHLADRPLLIEPQLSLPWGRIGGYADVCTSSAPWVVADFKYGYEIVDGSTPQLALYLIALILERDPGALEGDGAAYAVVLQPRARAEPARWYTWSYAALRALRDELIATLDRIRREDWSFAVGPWCRWCAAATVCPTLSATARDAAAVELGAPAEIIASGEFGAQQLNDALLLAPALEHRIRQAWATARAYLEAGGRLPDFKLVRRAKGGLTVAPTADARPPVDVGESLRLALRSSVAAGYEAAAQQKSTKS